MDRASLVDQVRQFLATEKAFGVQEYPVQKPAPAEISVAAPDVWTDPYPALDTLEKLKNEFCNCQMCPLGSTRTQFVFGQGSPAASLMFVGEAPGFEEDQQGLAFVGAAGGLLTKIIEAMKLKRDGVYIANCLKCRPPHNRNPLPGEIASCTPLLRKQVFLIRPKIICALGKFAAQTLLRTEEPISRLRGKFFDYHGIKLMPTFHPAYLLRNPADKKLVWEDMQKIMKELGIL